MRWTMHGRWRSAAAGAALLGLGLSGCANFWDDITARDIPFTQRCKEVYKKPDPLVVLRDSVDGDRRAKALRRLEEPKQNKGTDKEQDLVFEILSKTAVSDPQPLCRLIAIEKLGHFKDPRAPKALEAAFYGVDTIPAQFAKLTTRIQCTTITAMGNTGSSEVVALLAQVLREPPADRSDEAQHRNDRCTAAARALAHYNDAQATDALLHVMQDKKEDLALRDCAYTSLRESTGRHLPNDPDTWDHFLHPHDGSALAKGKDDNKLINLVNWFKHDSDLRPEEPKAPGKGAPTTPGSATPAAPGLAPAGVVPASAPATEKPKELPPPDPPHP
jgi:hypothetical protein